MPPCKKGGHHGHQNLYAFRKARDDPVKLAWNRRITHRIAQCNSHHGFSKRPDPRLAAARPAPPIAAAYAAASQAAGAQPATVSVSPDETPDLSGAKAEGTQPGAACSGDTLRDSAEEPRGSFERARTSAVAAVVERWAGPCRTRSLSPVFAHVSHSPAAAAAADAAGDQSSEESATGHVDHSDAIGGGASAASGGAGRGDVHLAALVEHLLRIETKLDFMQDAIDLLEDRFSIAQTNLRKMATEVAIPADRPVGYGRKSDSPTCQQCGRRFANLFNLQRHAGARACLARRDRATAASTLARSKSPIIPYGDSDDAAERPARPRKRARGAVSRKSPSPAAKEL